jgi:hypothetical protein
MKIYETTSMQHCKPWSFEETTGHPNGYRSLPCDHFRMGVHRVPQMISDDRWLCMLINDDMFGRVLADSLAPAST